MYPWSESLNSWGRGTGLKIDALGLVTLLGAEEMDRSIGRLVPSIYLKYLPLLGAFVIAGNRFTTKKPGFVLYNISAGIMTTELAGWFSRWLQTQDFKEVRSIVTWQVNDQSHRWREFIVGFLLVGLPVHGMLIALTVLAADWWGLANVIAMTISVAVRTKSLKAYPAKCAKYNESMERLESCRQKGQAMEGVKIPIEPQNPNKIAKVIVVTEDSKVVTLAVPMYLPRWAFATNPQPPNQYIYQACQWIGWAAFAVHVISIGMAALYTQIISVVVILVSTVLTAHRVGCEDSRIWESIRSHWGHEVQENSCWVSSNLKATVSTYPEEYMDWPELEEKNPLTVHWDQTKLFTRKTAPDAPSRLIEPFQKGETPTFIDHVKAGLKALAEDPHGLLVFSGGPTKKPRTELSEGQSYLNLARDNGYFQEMPTLPSIDPSRVIAETNATDSYQNLLFSLIQFRVYAGVYPQRVTVVTHEFKRARFMQCHFPAVGLVPVGLEQEDHAHKVAVIGINPPEEITPAETLTRGEAMNGIGLWRGDLYGVNSDLVGKRVKRGWSPGMENDIFPNLGLGNVVLHLIRYDGGDHCNKWFPKRESLPWSYTRHDTTNRP
ncbi:hypothetical protein N7527_007774 [Penicillium freii]|nr:hypothetical protein N7527_007774 [Penicillium freii]